MLGRAQTLVAVQETLGQVTLFSPAAPTRRRIIPVGEKPHEIELAPDGITAYVSNFGLLEANLQVGTPGTTISVLDCQASVEITRFTLPEGFTAPHGLKLRPPDYRELFTNAEMGLTGMVVFDAHKGSVSRTFALPPLVHNFVFDADGAWLYIFTLAGQVFRLDPRDGSVAAKIHTGSPRGLAWTADKRHLIASGRGEMLLLDALNLTVARRISGLGVGQIFYPAATPDGQWILAPAVLDGVVLVIEAGTGRIAHCVETGSPLLLALDPDGTAAWVSNVRIPAGLFGPETQPREGGVTHLDLSSFEISPVPGLVDANGLALTRADAMAAPDMPHFPLP